MQHLRTLRIWCAVLAEPFESPLAVAGLVYGIPVMLGLTQPSSLARQVTPWMMRAWAAGVVLAGALTLLARRRTARAADDSHREAAARVEVMGMSLSVGTYLMYALSILATGASGIPAGSVMAGLAVGYALRARAITVEWHGHRTARRPRRRRARPYA